MGRGDKKSKKGKIFKGSYGVVRPRKTNTVVISTPTKKKTAAKKKVTAKKKATTKKKATAKKKTTTKK